MKERLFSVFLALCVLLTACAAEKPSSSVPQPVMVSSEMPVEPVEPENLLETIAQAAAENQVDSLLAEHSNIVVENQEETLVLERLEEFITNVTEKTADDEIYILRLADPIPVIYWLNYTVGEPHYTLIISENGQQMQELTLTEVTKTDNEYVFVADPDFQMRSVEVGLRGQKGLSYNNRCEHTDMEHSIDSRFIKAVGTEAFEKWVEEKQSRTDCNINIYTFLKDFAISYENFAQILGDNASELYPVDEIIKQVYPQQLQNEQAAPGQPAGTEEPKAQETATVAVTGDNFLGSVESSIIDEINAERRSLGLGELTFDENLKAASRIRSRELCQNDVWGHVRPNGDSWVTVIEKDVPLPYKTAGENLATVEFNDPDISPHTDASWWFEEWKNSPPHYEAICKPEFTHVGAGVYYEERDDGSIVAYATTIFTKY